MATDNSRTIDFSDNIIQLHVGTEPTTLNVHQKVLCASSKFLKSVIKPEWEALRDVPKVVDLSDESIDTVRLYVHWLYFHDVQVQEENLENLDIDTVNDIYDLLAKAYVFGEKILDVKYKNAVLKKMVVFVDASKWFPKSCQVNLIYEGTVQGSPARRLMVDIVVSYAHGKGNWTKNIEEYDKDVVVDILKAIVGERKASYNRPWKENIESYLYLEEEPETTGGSTGSPTT